MSDLDPHQRPTPMDHLAVALAVTSAVLLASGLAFVWFQARGHQFGARDLVTLANATSPFVSLLALAAIVLVVVRRTSGEDGAPDRVAIAVATVVALASVLLALNGVVAEVAVSEMDGSGTRALYHLSSAGLAGVALWFAATAPARRGSRSGVSPPPSPPRGLDPGSPP